ncbi:MAG: RimK family alpha-L-glutamate ligase [Desulfuromonas sp.]|nr:MAG: RimK family alpha-L-glutamate ligase [Desulfuromonas sp.]
MEPVPDPRVLLVVDRTTDWLLNLEGVEVVTARDYLTQSTYQSSGSVRRLFNLCRSYRYQSLGYYVSLLAAARGHKPQPDIGVLQDFRSRSTFRLVSEELDQIIQRSLAPLQGKEFLLSVYFGRNLAKRYDRLSAHLFRLLPAPFLQAQFIYNDRSGKWLLQTAGPIPTGEVPDSHREFALDAAREFFRSARLRRQRRFAGRYDLAILVDPDDTEPPSNPRALQRFIRAAKDVGFNCEFLRRSDIGRLAEFDALFIRATTNVNHFTFRFSRRAVAEGLVVIDDPESILRCTNKVYLAERMERHGIPTPRTCIIHRGNRDQVLGQLGLPCILKQPDSAFSQGVNKVESTEELSRQLDELLRNSDLIIGQEFLPTPFDWRIGVLDRKPIYACRYYMARGHWQILRRDDGGSKCEEGDSDTVPLDNVPRNVLRTAVKAAGLIGDSLYGVDLKQVGNRVLVIEVNDNPNIDAGIEDLLQPRELYRTIVSSLMRRVEERRQGRSR